METLDIFLAQNPWQSNKDFRVTPFIERDVFQQALSWLDKDEIITITGPRQAGKTTVLLKLIEHLLQKQQEPTSIYYFNFDQEEHRETFQKPQQLFSFLQSRGEYRRYFLFLDEVQRLEEAGLYLKILHDLTQKPLKIIVSGSSSLLLRAKTKEHLTGRQVEFRLLPLSFKEAAGHYQFKLPAGPSGPLLSLLNQFAVYGGYPRIFREKNPQVKEQLLDQLYRDYVRKDIRDFAEVERVSSFNKLTRLLAYQVGNLISKEELASSSGLDVRTLGKYLEILEETFVVKLLEPYFTNRRKEIVKSPKVFYLDNGLRNGLLNNFEEYDQRPDQGKLFENLVLTELEKYLPAGTQLRYWRTQAGAELDFVLIKGERLIPIEVKTIIKSARTTKGLRSFLDDYDVKQAFVVSTEFSGKTRYLRTDVKFIPFSRLLEVFQ